MVGMDEHGDLPFQTPLVLLTGDIGEQDRQGLAGLDHTQREQQLRARTVLHRYVETILDRAEADGRTWLTDASLTSWVNLRDLTALLVAAAEDPG